MHPLAANAQEATTVTDGTNGFLDGTDTAAQLDYPFGMVVQRDSLFVADAYRQRIRKIILCTLCKWIHGQY